MAGTRRSQQAQRSSLYKRAGTSTTPCVVAQVIAPHSSCPHHLPLPCQGSQHASTSSGSSPNAYLQCSPVATHLSGCLGQDKVTPFCLKRTKVRGRLQREGCEGPQTWTVSKRFSSNPVQKTQVTPDTHTVCPIPTEGTLPSNRPEHAALFQSLNTPCWEARDCLAISPRHLSTLACPCCLPGWTGSERCSRHRGHWAVNGPLQGVACVPSPEPWVLCMPGTHYNHKDLKVPPSHQVLLSQREGRHQTSSEKRSYYNQVGSSFGQAAG